MAIYKIQKQSHSSMNHTFKNYSESIVFPSSLLYNIVLCTYGSE